MPSEPFDITGRSKFSELAALAGLVIQSISISNTDEEKTDIDENGNIASVAIGNHGTTRDVSASIENNSAGAAFLEKVGGEIVAYDGKNWMLRSPKVEKKAGEWLKISFQLKRWDGVDLGTPAPSTP